jgi:hypothetical protein
VDLLSSKNGSQLKTTDNNQPALHNFRYFLLAASLVTFLLIMMGYVVRVSAAASEIGRASFRERV